MEKNSNNSKPVGVCKRIFRAFKGQTKQESSSHKATRKTDLSSVMRDDRTNSNVSMTKPVSTVAAGQKHRVGFKDDVKDDDKFSDFISKAKMKIRTVSNVGGAVKRPARTGSINDRALDYINRAKMRIRMTSTRKWN